MREEPVWTANDSAHVALWKQALFTGCPRAAVGLLADVFDTLGRCEERDPQRPASLDAAASHCREDAMVMLGDEDGTMLREWLDLYRSDKGAWEERAFEWVEHCRQDDVFELFN